MRRHLLIVLPVLLLSACSNLMPKFNTQSTEIPTEAPVTSAEVSTSSSEIPSSSSVTTPRPSFNEDVNFNIYATNDIHGQIYSEKPQQYKGSVGIGKVMTYLKNMKDDSSQNAFLIDSGDTWQGSIYSNTNKGRLITDAINYVHYDARTIGNHDLDWGLQALKDNNNATINGYKTPALCANVYDFDFAHKTVGTTYQSDLAQKSVTYTLSNGFKVGIVGVIGSKQITSITSTFVQDITFTDHIKAIKDETEKLRQEGCNAVIASVHGSYDDVKEQNLEGVVDLVLCAHTHQNVTNEEGTLKFAQFGKNNRLR